MTEFNKYNDYFTEEQLLKMKDIHIKQLKEKEYLIGLSAEYSLIIGFFMVMSLFAMLLWFSKISIFIFTGVLLIEVPLIVMTLRTTMKYKKLVITLQKELL